MKIRATAFLAAAAAAWLAGSARAALVFQSEFAQYAVDAAGSAPAAVKLYLAQTEGTTTLSDGGGLNSVGFEVVTNGGASAATLQAIAHNPQFTGGVTKSLAAGSLYAEHADLTAGVPVVDGRVFLGTFTYAGHAGVTAATFTVRDKSTTDTFTATGVNLDALTQPGTFVVAVPEPTALMPLAAAALFARRRRARRTIAAR